MHRLTKDSSHEKIYLLRFHNWFIHELYMTYHCRNTLKYTIYVNICRQMLTMTRASALQKRNFYIHIDLCIHIDLGHCATHLEHCAIS